MQLTVKHTFYGHRGSCYCLSLSDDGNTLVTGSKDGKLRVFDLAAGKLAATIDASKSPIMGIALSPDGKLAATGNTTNQVQFFDIAAGKEGAKYMGGSGHHGTVNGMAIAPDGSFVLSVADDRKVMRWDPIKAKQRAVMNKHEAPALCVAIAPDGKRCVSAGSDGTARIWNLESGDQLHVMRPGPSSVMTAAWSPDGSLVATGGNDEFVRLFNPETGEPVKDFPTGVQMLNSLAFSPDSKQLVAGGTDNNLFIWDIENPALTPANSDPSQGDQRVQFKGHTNHILCVAWSKDGNRVITGSKDETVRVWG
jgi:WD40 repeat protein